MYTAPRPVELARARHAPPYVLHGECDDTQGEECQGRIPGAAPERPRYEVEEGRHRGKEFPGDPTACAVVPRLMAMPGFARFSPTAQSWALSMGI